MPRPGEDRSDVGGAAQFNNIGPVPLSLFPLSLFLSDLPRFLSPDLSRFLSRFLPRAQQLVSRLEVLPLGVEGEREVVVVGGGVVVVVGEQAAADLQGLLQQRLCLGVLPLG